MIVYVMVKSDFQSSDPDEIINVVSDIKKGKNYLKHYHNKDGAGFFESMEEAKEAVKTGDYSTAYVWNKLYNLYTEHHLTDKEIQLYYDGEIRFKPFNLID